MSGDSILPLDKQQLCLDMPRLTPKYWVLVCNTRPYTLDSARFALLDMSPDIPRICMLLLLLLLFSH